MWNSRILNPHFRMADMFTEHDLLIKGLELPTSADMLICPEWLLFEVWLDA